MVTTTHCTSVRGTHSLPSGNLTAPSCIARPPPRPRVCSPFVGPWVVLQHFADLFGAHSAALAAAEAACDWSILGPVMRDRAVGSSTFWFGTELAHTPCHLDTYGVNFVAQLHGHKVGRAFVGC